MTKTPVVAGIIIFVISIVSYVVMSALHLDTSGLTVFVGMAAGAGGFAAWRNTEKIREQTNGPLTDMGERVVKLEIAVQDISDRLESKGV